MRRAPLILATIALLAAAAAPAAGSSSRDVPSSARQAATPYRWHVKHVALRLRWSGLGYRVDARAERRKSGWSVVLRVVATPRDGRAWNVVDGSVRTSSRFTHSKGRVIQLGYTRIGGIAPTVVRLWPGRPWVEVDRPTPVLRVPGYLELSVAVLTATLAGGQPRYGRRTPLAMVRLERDRRGRVRIGVRRHPSSQAAVPVAARRARRAGR